MTSSAVDTVDHLHGKHFRVALDLFEKKTFDAMPREEAQVANIALEFNGGGQGWLPRGLDKRGTGACVENRACLR